MYNRSITALAMAALILAAPAAKAQDTPAQWAAYIQGS